MVITRNSSFVYKGQSVDVAEVARQPGVRYVLEGSVRTSGERVRIAAQLVEAETREHVWAQRYDRESSDIFEVHDEITKLIVGVVAGRIDDAERVISRSARLITEDMTERGESLPDDPLDIVTEGYNRIVPCEGIPDWTGNVAEGLEMIRQK